MKSEHEPVLKTEVLHWLQPLPGGIYVDATVGCGGHSAAILERAGASATLIGIDRDPAALEAAKQCLQAIPGTFRLFQANFRFLDRVLARAEFELVDGILLDLGVSSPQLDQPERGFSYRAEAPLDMRMDPGQELTAAKLVNQASQQKLEDLIQKYGEERWAARIAQFIVARRQTEPIQTTDQLVDVIKAAIPAGARRRGPHPAKRTFQALRIAVNDELNNLQLALDLAVRRLKTGGRVCVISFHSLEDRIVKRRFRYHEQDCICPPDLPVCRCDKQRELRVLTRKPVTPGEAELQRNPRARSARLRAAERV